MFLMNQAFGFLRRVCRNHVGKAGVAGDVGVLVDHRDVTLGDTSNDKLVVNPNANNRIPRHEETLKAPADDLRDAAHRIRRDLCYGGSGHDFYSTVAEWFEREAGQAERLIHPGMWGVADDLATRAARAFLGRRAD